MGLSKLNGNVPFKLWREVLWPFGLVKVLLVPVLHLDKPKRPQALTFKHSRSRMLLHWSLNWESHMGTFLLSPKGDISKKFRHATIWGLKSESAFLTLRRNLWNERAEKQSCLRARLPGFALPDES